MHKSYCKDCYYDVYNHGLGGAKECWSFKDAELILQKEVSIDQIPPWTQESHLFPNCYRRSRFVYVRPDQEN